LYVVVVGLEGRVIAVIPFTHYRDVKEVLKVIVKLLTGGDEVKLLYLAS